MTIIEGSDCTVITINEIPVCALCGPVLRGRADYDGCIGFTRKIVADEGNLPVDVGQSVEIDGEVWEVSDSVVFAGSVSVTFTRTLC